MPTLTSISRISDELQKLPARLRSHALVFHTDLIAVGLVPHAQPRKRLLADYFDAIRQAFPDCTLLFPTFNYEYLHTGKYDVLADPCQVGVLNEFVRQQDPTQRTWTPVFNFGLYQNSAFPLSPVSNPFSIESTFGEMVRRQATLVFFGAPFSAVTFLHHVEEIAQIGYRYLKPFPGIIQAGAARQAITLHYRVRPLTDAIDYDWSRLELELEQRGILQRFPLGNSRLLCCRADHLFEYWGQRLQADELYLLTPVSRAKVQALFEQYGKPLVYEIMEPLSR